MNRKNNNENSNNIIVDLIIGAYVLMDSGDVSFSDGDYICTEQGTVLNVPNNVELKSSNDGIEIYSNKYTDFIIVNNNDSRVIDYLESACTSGEYQYCGIYKTSYQYLGNNWNTLVGENLAIKEDTLLHNLCEKYYNW